MFDANSLPNPVRIDLKERSYDIRFCANFSGIFSETDLSNYDALVVITNPNIWQVYGQSFLTELKAQRTPFSVWHMQDGEKYKNLDSASGAWDHLIEKKYTRNTCVIAFGGGVVGDLAGFVAASFLRGVDYIQVPTTVVAMVDSSVGGKTGLDHKLGKNLIGAFYQPKQVVIMLDLLKSLDDHNLRGGFAEVIKYGVIYDAEFFTWLEENLERAMALETDAIAHVVRRSCEIKADVVSQDERESGLRAILNYGHTFAHAIEALDEYSERQFHGQAVAIGMCCAADLAVNLGMLSPKSSRRIEALIERAGLPRHVAGDMDPSAIYEKMFSDKKVAAGKVRFILPQEIGQVELVSNVDRDEVLKAISARQK